MLKSLIAAALLAAGALAGGVPGTARAGTVPEVEVLHWWTSGGEARAVDVLRRAFEARGGHWSDMPVAGGGGEAAMAALRARILSGNPPTAVQLKGPAIQEWHAQGVLADISDVAEAQHWDRLLPAEIARAMRCGDDWCAAPVNIHRIDWIWANAAVLKAQGIAMPRSWGEFNAAAEKLKAAGIIPLAHGGQAWQDATLFETVALGIGGPAFYRRALIDLDPAALGSPTMIRVFDQMRTLRGFVDDNFPGRDWNLATAMVINGEAAFQIMGDWAKAEFLAAGETPGEDFLCGATPGAGYLYTVDSFAMFKVSDPGQIAGQRLLAELTVAPAFQRAFNLAKGSIPVRQDLPLDGFDACALRSKGDLTRAEAAGAMLPSVAHGMALRGAQAGAITDVVTAHFNSDMTSEDAARMLVDAVANTL